MQFHVDAALGHFDAFGFEEFSLKGGVRLADQEFAICADDAMPRNAFARRATCHSASCGSSPAREAEGFGNSPIG